MRFSLPILARKAKTHTDTKKCLNLGFGQGAVVHAYLETKYWKLRRIQAATHVSMENEIAQVLAKLPDTSDIHAKHHALYCWQQERKAKKILHQSRKKAK